MAPSPGRTASSPARPLARCCGPKRREERPMRTEYEENREFEAEVRRVAEAVWGQASGECQPEHYSNDPIIRELDGIARLRDITHVLMATVSRKLEKAKDDVKK